MFLDDCWHFLSESVEKLTAIHDYPLHIDRLLGLRVKDLHLLEVSKDSHDKFEGLSVVVYLAVLGKKNE